MKKVKPYHVCNTIILIYSFLQVGSDNGGTTHGTTSKFHVNHDINAKLYIWRGAPWALEVDAVVNSSNEVTFARFYSTVKTVQSTEVIVYLFTLFIYFPFCVYISI